MKVGIRVYCTVCHRAKAPHGRSVPDATYSSWCTHECGGYYDEPKPGCLWPGETSEQFGYEHCGYATAESRPSEPGKEKER